MTVLPPETCDRYYLGRIRPSMFCAGRDKGGVDACQVRLAQHICILMMFWHQWSTSVIG